MDLGDAVVFTDDRNLTCVGRITRQEAWGQPGVLLIKKLGDDSYGAYQRYPKEVRLAQDWEVHQAGLHEGVLE